MTQGSPPNAGTPRLDLSTKLYYGTGAIAPGVVSLSFASTILTVYLTRVIGLPAVWVGTAIMVTLMIDAVIDPLIGQWSDNLRTRWGRRHPPMYASALLSTAACYFFWNSPRDWSPGMLGAYLIGMLVALRICVSLYEVPSTALTPELAPDYHERTSLFSYRFFFGSTFSLAMNVVLYRFFLTPENGGVLSREGYAGYGVVAAVVLGAAILISTAGTHKEIPRLHRPPLKRVTLGEMFRDMFVTLTNRSLLMIMIAGLLGGVAGGMGASLTQFFQLELWGLDAAQISDLYVATFIATLAAIAAAPPLSRRFGKKNLMISLAGVAMVTAGLPLALKLLGLMPPNSSPWVFVILFADTLIASNLQIMSLIIVSSMIADVTEDAAVKTGVRSEGLVFAANGLLPKFTAGIGIFLGGVLLTVVDFPTDAAQGTVDPAIMRHLALLYLPLSLVLGGLALTFLCFYRIDQSTHERNLALLREAAGESQPPARESDLHTRRTASSALSTSMPAAIGESE